MLGDLLMLKKHYLLIILALLVAACKPALGPTVTISQTNMPATATVSTAFQNQLSPLPTVPSYRCGAWSSNTAPTSHATLTIYAKLTSYLTGVPDATASA